MLNLKLRRVKAKLNIIPEVINLFDSSYSSLM